MCIAKGLMGSRPGRVCLSYQVDFIDETLEYSSVTRQGSKSGLVTDYEQFFDAIDDLMELHKTDRVEVALKFFRVVGKRINGVCPKSFPRTPFTTDILSKLNLCIGGSSGTEIVNMPYPGNLFDQPNIFIEAYYVYLDEFSKYMRYVRSKDAKQASR